jgi:replicative superfamily II helicase
MPVTADALTRVEAHWAVEAVGGEATHRAREEASLRLLVDAVGDQLSLADAVEAATTPEALARGERAAAAYEMALIEAIDSLLSPGGAEEAAARDLAQAGAYRAYELRRTLPLTDDPFARVFEVLHLAALAYCGDRWAELRSWIHEQKHLLEAPAPDSEIWEERLVSRIYECWIRLLRKDGWNDLDRVASLIAGLRADQAEYEPAALEKDETGARRAAALRLVALYHWARATELLAEYMLQGTPTAIDSELDRHFDAGHRAAAASADVSLDVLLRFLHVAARRMTGNSLWWVATRVTTRVPGFVETVTRQRGLFELLPPQRIALSEQGLLDPISRGIVVDLPTSGGKTLLAEFRILQALNQFDVDQGWIAYVAPTRALVSQLTRRLRSDLGPIGVEVEQLSSAVEIDAFEEQLLEDGPGDGAGGRFDVLVATPEKLDSVIRAGAVTRPLALVVMDEAQNLEDEDRGLRIELTLAMIRRDKPDAGFLLLMPHVPNADDLARWLGGETGRSIRLGTSAWQPNDRMVGMFHAEEEEGPGNWSMRFESLVSPRTVHVDGVLRAGGLRPLRASFSSTRSTYSRQAAAMARIFSDRGTSIALARDIPNCWKMASEVAATLDPIEPGPEIQLVQRFLKTEISESFALVDLLEKGVGVHHAGLSDETRALIEWLTEERHLRILCATTTIAQGINFPVSSVFLGSLQLAGRRPREMSKRAFWNLAGRAGRIDQDPVGVIGLARGADPDQTRRYVSAAVEDLVSRLARMLKEVDDRGQLANLALVIQEEQWTDFRMYVAHLWNEHRNLQRVIADSESMLQNTFGFSMLRRSSDPAERRRAEALLEATRGYAAELAKRPQDATLADATGFAPEAVRRAIAQLGQLEDVLDLEAWEPTNLFSRQGGSVLPELIGIMMAIPQLGSLNELSRSGLSRSRIADMSMDWVAGETIERIAEKYFKREGVDETTAISTACRAIYRTLTNTGTWGLAALAKLPRSGIDFEALSDEQRRMIGNLPAMLYHGVSTEAGVLMRMNSVPRSVAENVGDLFVERSERPALASRPADARRFLTELSDADWHQAAPVGSAMSGEDFRQVWKQLSGDLA